MHPLPKSDIQHKQMFKRILLNYHPNVFRMLMSPTFSLEQPALIIQHFQPWDEQKHDLKKAFDDATSRRN